MTDTPILPENEDDLLAAEYVSGLLDLAERVQVETRIRRDTVFAGRVTDWENRLADLNDDYPEVPAPDLMPQIEARLFPVAAKPRRSNALWAWAASALAAMAVFAYLAFTPAAPSYVATLTADAGALRYQAVITQDKLTITRVSGDPAQADKAHELWIIAGDNPPVSLGVLPADSETITLPGVAPGQVLAVTEEQAGGSPDGKPHGPIIAKGVLTDA
jgi:anti-sigma-K factor RskA